MPGTLKVKDVNDPTGLTWIPVAGVGPRGPQGPEGVGGPVGPMGPTGPGADEVWIGPDMPDVVAMPAVELWYDSDDTAALGPVSLPIGGLINQLLTKASAADGDIHWTGPYLLQTGGTLTGDLTVTGRTQVNGVLAAPSVTGDMNVAGALSALSVEDRTFSRHYDWISFDLNPHFAPNWGNGDFQSGQFPGPAALHRNAFAVVLSLSAHINPGSWQENVWMRVLNAGAIPVGWRPQFDLWQTAQGVETDETGSTFETRVTNTGDVWVQMKGASLDWQDDTRIPFNYSWPRSNT